MASKQIDNRIRVFGVDGLPLASTTPQRARKMVRDKVAEKGTDGSGFYIRMKIATGTVLPCSVPSKGGN